MARTVKAPGRIQAADERSASANYHSHALARGLALLELLADGPQPLTLFDFHQRTGLPKSTLVRLLAVLAELEFVVRVDERPAFRLGHKLLTLSTAYVSALDLSVVAGPHLHTLATATGQTTNLGLLDGDQVLHVCVEQPSRPIRFTAMTGTRDAAYCTALGKLLLAQLAADQWAGHLPAAPFPARTSKTITTADELARELRRTARRGYALDDNENAVGLRCLAVPVEVAGETMAALSVSGPSAEFTAERLKGYLEPLHATAAALAASADVAAALRVVQRSLRAHPGPAPA